VSAEPELIRDARAHRAQLPPDQREAFDQWLTAWERYVLDPDPNAQEPAPLTVGPKLSDVESARVQAAAKLIGVTDDEIQAVFRAIEG